MKYIVQAVRPRESYVEEMRQTIPGLDVYYDDSRDATSAFIQTLRLADDEPHVHLEDDVVLCKGFVAKTKLAANLYGDRVIQFFHWLRKPEPTRLVTPPGFYGALAVYFPRGYSSKLIAFMEEAGLDLWRFWNGSGSHCLDMGIQHFLRARREPFVQHYPSLVQHRVSPSTIKSHRQQKRQTAYFADDVTA